MGHDIKVHLQTWTHFMLVLCIMQPVRIYVCFSFQEIVVKKAEDVGKESKDVPMEEAAPAEATA